MRPGWSRPVNRLIGLAFVIGAIVWLLDLHSHECEACGRRWRHVGLITGGEWANPKALRSHTCRCGTEQWRRGA